MLLLVLHRVLKILILEIFFKIDHLITCFDHFLHIFDLSKSVTQRVDIQNPKNSNSAKHGCKFKATVMETAHT